jgi:PPOX class probable F420-dependent enzyme
MITPDQFASILRLAPIGRLAMTTRTGAAGIVPIVFVVLDGAIWSPVDGKRKRTSELGRLANLAADPRCAVLIDRYAEDWRRLWWVRIDCAASIRAMSPDDPRIASLERALRDKYPQYSAVQPLRFPVRAIELEPIRHVAWAADESIWQNPFD